MSNGFILRYVEAWSMDKAARLLAELEYLGFHLGNPATGAISELSADWETMGEQVFVSRDELEADLSLQTRDQLNFQIWLDYQTDISSTIRRVGNGLAVQDFSLDGLTLEEERTSVEKLSATVLRPSVDLCAAVVDTRGVTEELNWDSIVSGAPILIDPRPELVALAQSVDTRHEELSEIPSRRVGDLVIRSMI
ncbi:hypothetical protein [Nocardia brasiliensis]|uniref:hypothetical protein n=1 Tax=Nocardia brasiliensis TaxID=37326 RepID=UPI00189547C2|nr:hypothetical protein [Nocardia brasiliensis]MBF6127782.1 hypothetical protein [Nocardia brasiliensis]